MLWRLQGELLHDYDRKLNWFKIMKKTKTSKTVILALKDLLPPNYETNLSYWKKFHPVPKVLLTFTRFPSIWILVGIRALYRLAYSIRYVLSIRMIDIQYVSSIQTCSNCPKPASLKHLFLNPESELAQFVDCRLHFGPAFFK